MCVYTCIYSKTLLTRHARGCKPVELRQITSYPQFSPGCSYLYIIYGFSVCKVYVYFVCVYVYTVYGVLCVYRVYVCVCTVYRCVCVYIYCIYLYIYSIRTLCYHHFIKLTVVHYVNILFSF